MNQCDLAAAMTAAIEAHCRKHGAIAAREVLRHIRDAQERPASARSESLLAELAQKLEQILEVET